MPRRNAATVSTLLFPTVIPAAVVWARAARRRLILPAIRAYLLAADESAS